MNLLARWHDLDIVERVARCRSLALGARLLAGDKADGLVSALRRAETDVEALPTCDAELHHLSTITMRRLLSTFAMTLR